MMVLGDGSTSVDGRAFRSHQRTLAATNEEFDPGSGRTLAACLMHASRTQAS
jgi:hypothetical protein